MTEAAGIYAHAYVAACWRDRDVESHRETQCSPARSVVVREQGTKPDKRAIPNTSANTAELAYEGAAASCTSADQPAKCSLFSIRVTPGNTKDIYTNKN